MKMVKIFLISVMFFGVISSSFGQDNRTFWEKIFGKKKTEEINVEEPKNSQDSLAILLNDHLNTNSSESEMQNDSSIVNDLSLNTEPGEITFIIPDHIQQYFDTVSAGEIRGWRIQVFRGDYNKARTIRASLLNQGERATLDYDQSDYSVRLGDYRTYMAAEKSLVAIRKTYPSAYVVKDNIKLN